MTPASVTVRVQAYGDTVDQLVAEVSTQLAALAGLTYSVDVVEYGPISRSGTRWGVTATATLLSL